MGASLPHRVERARKPVSESAQTRARLEIDFQRDAGLVLACLNLAIEESGDKRDALASLAEMSPGQFSKVTTPNDHKGLPAVLDALPHTVRVKFLEHYGRAHGVRMVERETAELTEEFYDSLARLIQVARLLLIRRPVPAQASLKGKDV
jgi:hypothetical protein